MRTGKPWTARSILGLRTTYGIPSGLTRSAELRLPEGGYVTSTEAAQRLGVSHHVIERWYRMGILQGKHASKQAHLWIHWTDDLVERLNGQAAWDERMVAVRSLCRTRQQSVAEVLAWAHAEGYAIYRLRRGSGFRFYLQLRTPVDLLTRDAAPQAGTDERS